MIGVLKKIWDFAGEEQGNIRKSMILGFFYAVFHMFQIAAIYVVVLALVGGSTDPAPAWQALGLLLASILGRAVLNRFSQLQQTHAGYFMVANKRISIGDKLKRVPMGYFNDQSLGELTGITTTVLDEVESTGPMVLVGILGGLINSAVMPWRECWCIWPSSPGWRSSPPRSPPSVSGTRPGWWRRCWNSSRA